MMAYSKHLMWPSVQNFIEFNFHESFKNGTLNAITHLRFAKQGHSKLQIPIFKSDIPSPNSEFTKTDYSLTLSALGVFFSRGKAARA